MDLHCKEKKALILASTSGLGFAAAKALSDESAHIALCGRSEDKLKKAIEKIPQEEGFKSDLSNPGSAEELMDEVLKKWKEIDILVTHSPSPPSGTFSELSPSDWQKGFQGLFLNPLTCIHKVLPHMQKKKWGRIIMITSFAAKEPVNNLTVSNALRAGLLGLTNTLSKECAPFQITVNSVLPGYTKTEGLMELDLPEKTFVDQIPMKRLGSSEEIGALCAFLAGNQAAFITGQEIACDGGLLQGI